jgi:hypothetical protein
MRRLVDGNSAIAIVSVLLLAIIVASAVKALIG